MASKDQASIGVDYNDIVGIGAVPKEKAGILVIDMHPPTKVKAEVLLGYAYYNGIYLDYVYACIGVLVEIASPPRRPGPGKSLSIPPPCSDTSGWYL